MPHAMARPRHPELVEATTPNRAVKRKATIDSQDAEQIGTLPNADRLKVVRQVRRLLAQLLE